MISTPTFLPCGEHAWLLDFETNEVVHCWAEAIQAADLPGVVEVVPGLSTLLVTADPHVTTAAVLKAALRNVIPRSQESTAHEHHIIEVRYDGEDLDTVAELTGLSTSEVVAAHTSTAWRAAFCGFAPGFTYLVGGDQRLSVPRRDESRIRVPAGAVAIAGDFSAVYPRVSPGGWQLLGHTDAVLWNSEAHPPATLNPGSTVEFRSVN